MADQYSSHSVMPRGLEIPGAVRSWVRTLTADERLRYDHVPETDRDRAILIRIPPVIGPYRGLTIGRFVMLAERVTPEKPSSLLAHELVHVQQFRQQGLPRFTWQYNRAFTAGLVRLRSWNGAYRAIPAEVEARRLTGAWARQLHRRLENDA